MFSNWKRRIAIVLVLAGALLIGVWAYTNRSSAVYDRIIRQQGYSVTLIKEQITTKFYLKPEWIPKNNGEERQLNLVVDDKFGTKIILQKVGKREHDFYIQLDAKPYPHSRSGHLLTTTLINPDGSYSYSSPGPLDRWVATTPSGEDILNRSYGTGDGPGNFSFLFIDDAYLEKFEQGAYIRFSGYNLYGYRNLSGSRGIPWLFIVYPVLLLALAVFYRRRQEQEDRLGWKLVGYCLLGGFTFTINAVKLPLGFAAYLLFFRKPKINFKIKQQAALLGLLVYASQLLVPAVAGFVNSPAKQMTIREVPIEQIGVDGIWRTMTAQAPVSKQAKLLRYKTVLSSGGDVQELTFQVVDRGQNQYVLTQAVYDPRTKSLALTRSTTGQWVQYNRQIPAEHFFARVIDFRLMDLKTAGNDPYVKLEVMEDGTPVNYGMKGGHKFRVDQKGVDEIGNEQLPARGYWLSACGIKEYDKNKPPNECEDRTDYLFDSES